MEKLQESSNNGKLGFIQHVFRFEDEDKGHMLNIIQYSVLAIIPIILILKFLRHYIPEYDENKVSSIVLAEVVGQILFMLFSIYFIHRIIIFIPTYSGFKYNDFNMINFILAFLMLLFTMNTRIGEKVQLLVERTQDLFTGNKKQEANQGNANTSVRVSQPLAPQHQTSSAMQANVNLNPQMPTQPSPDFNQFYQKNDTPLVNAQAPTQSQEPMMNYNEPAAANDFGGGFGTPF